MLQFLLLDMNLNCLVDPNNEISFQQIKSVLSEICFLGFRYIKAPNIEWNFIDCKLYINDEA